MSNRLSKSFDFLIRALLAESTRRQIAMGIVVGGLLGILPKDNLVFVGLLVGLFAARINLAAGLASMLVFSYLGHAGDPLFDLVGRLILTRPIARPLFDWLLNQPLVAWTELNNTVVLGATVVGGLLFYPSYRLVLLWMDHHANQSLVSTELSSASRGV